MFDLIVARPETEANIKGAADVCPPQPLVRPISPVDSNAVLIWRHCAGGSDTHLRDFCSSVILLLLIDCDRRVATRASPKSARQE